MCTAYTVGFVLLWPIRVLIQLFLEPALNIKYSNSGVRSKSWVSTADFRGRGGRGRSSRRSPCGDSMFCRGSRLWKCRYHCGKLGSTVHGELWWSSHGREHLCTSPKHWCDRSHRVLNRYRIRGWVSLCCCGSVDLRALR